MAEAAPDLGEQGMIERVGPPNESLSNGLSEALDTAKRAIFDLDVELAHFQQITLRDHILRSPAQEKLMQDAFALVTAKRRLQQ